jgi:DNA-binding protein HU-beta
VLAHFSDKFEPKRSYLKELFEDLAALATNEVKHNGEFALPDFGKLVLAWRQARKGRNPATGETFQIPAKTALRFRGGNALKGSVVPAN